MEQGVATPDELLRRFVSAVNEQDWERFAGVLADDVINHESGDDLHGVDAIVELNKRFHEANRNATINLTDTVASDDRVAGIEHVSADGLDTWGIFYGRVKDGEFTELWITGEW